MRGRAKGEIRGTVLIADDHEVVRLGLVLLLRRCLGAKKIVQAECFSEVIGHLKETDLTLAIVDLTMPGLSGPQDIARIRLLRPDARVVVLSGSTSRKDILDALSAGVHGYIVKNLTSEDLIDKLRYVLSGEIYVPPILAEQAPEHAESVAQKGVLQPAQNILSNRQRQVLKGLLEGKSNKEIAQELKVAEGTVKMHLAALFRVLGAANRAHAAALGKHLIG
jgi:DNA-binding NarL/FixJ family response regulator